MSDVRVNVVSPEGDVVSLPASQVNEATQPENGFRIASPQEVEHHFKQEKFGSIPQQAATALEGAAEGVAGPLATAAELGSGITTPENILARRQVNPGVHALGQAAGLTGSALMGEGLAPMLGAAGEGAVGLSGLEGATSALGKIGAAGVRTAAEMAVLQSGDEISKMLMHDPSQSMQTALVNVGLSALVGGAGGSALGAVNPLWEVAGGPKLTEFLDDFKGRLGQHITGTVDAAAPTEATPSISKQVFDPFTGKTLEKTVSVPAQAAEEMELTPGMKAADFIVKKGLEKLAGKGIAGAIGASLGSSVGHPWIGAALGERTLGPLFDSILPAIAKPIMTGMSDGGALKSAIDYGMNVIQGDKLMSVAAKNVFKPGAEVLTNSALPKMKDREKLIKQLQQLDEEPGRFLNQSDKYTQYLPDHAGAKGATVGAAHEYLKGMEPKAHKNLLLDNEQQPSAQAQAEYNRALDLAEQPALAFERIKNGTINANDIKLIQTVYPAFYKSAVMKLHTALVDHMAKEGTIPYHTRLGLAKFFNEPLDSTMLPQSLSSIQQSLTAVPMKPPMQVPKRGGGSGGKAKALEKQSNLLQSPQQASETRHRAQF